MSLAISLLDLAANLGRLHARSAQGSITVVPVIWMTSSTAMPVLRSLAEISEGVVLDAGDPSLQMPVPGTDDAARRVAVTTALRSPSPE